MTYKIEELSMEDLTKGFFETLNDLSNATFDLTKSIDTYLTREWKGIKTFVYKQDGEVLGMTSVLIEPKYSHDYMNVAHIEDVVVRKGYQRQGIGTALVNHAIEYAKLMDCYKVILDRGEQVAGFYERMGFKPHETGMRLDL